MERIQTLEVLLHDLSRCHKDNGINILMIDGVSETAIECIESIDRKSGNRLAQIKEKTIHQLDSIPEMVKKYKKTFNRETRTGDPHIYRQCVETAEHAISDFIHHFSEINRPARHN